MLNLSETAWWWWWCGGMVVWWCGGLVAWWCGGGGVVCGGGGVVCGGGGAVVRWCGVWWFVVWCVVVCGWCVVVCGVCVVVGVGGGGTEDSGHGVSGQARADEQQIGWQNTWEQAPVPATPSPP